MARNETEYHQSLLQVKLVWRTDAVFSTQRLTLDPQHLQRAVELRHKRLHLRDIALLLAAPFSTVGRALNRLRSGRLLNLKPKTPVQRYEREWPGALIHIDIKKLASFRKVKHHITGNRQQGPSRQYALSSVALSPAVSNTTVIRQRQLSLQPAGLARVVKGGHENAQLC